MEAAVVILVVAAAFAIILVPVLRGGHAPTDTMSDEPLEAAVTRYREALRADTVCARCGQANPPSSRYCFECGRPLSAADAEEFDAADETA